jgi:alpha-1,2-mannosyltransferase
MYKKDAGNTPFVRGRRGRSPSPTPSPSPSPAARRSASSGAPASPAAAAAHAAAAAARAALGVFASAPHPDLSAVLLVLVRMLGAYFVTAQWDRDADEAFNYFEPMHYMLYGSGLQTWENNVRYMFRSYGYGGLYAVLGFLLGGMYGEDKITVFYRLRLFLALACASAEAFLYASVKQRFGARIAVLMLLGMLLNAGMLQVASSYLPNSFTMVGFMVAWGLWLRARHAAAAAVAATALALGFPFAVLALPPLGVHILGCTLPPALLAWAPLRAAAAWFAPPPPDAVRRKAAAAAAWSWAPLLAVAGAAAGALALATAYAAAVDRAYYGVWASYQVNTLLYNLGIRSDGNGLGSNNFADATVADPKWYALHFAISHNVIAAAALACPAVLLLHGLVFTGLRPSATTSWAAALVAQFFLYFAFFSLKAHKEERFVYPIYPLVPLLAAFSLDALLDAGARLLQRARQAVPLPPPRALAALAVAAVALFFSAAAALSLSRIAMASAAFTGHAKLWTHFARSVAFRLDAAAPAASLYALAHPFRGLLAAAAGSSGGGGGGGGGGGALAPRALTVCAGQEWHRFPSSFFLPEKTGRSGAEGGAAQLRFIRFEPDARTPHPCLPHAFNTSAWGGQAPNALFNSDNREVPEFFVDAAKDCDYIVDFKRRDGEAGSNARQPWFAAAAALEEGKCSGGWRSLHRERFLDRESNPGVFARTFYVPGVSERAWVWGSYHLLQKC